MKDKLLDFIALIKKTNLLLILFVAFSLKMMTVPSDFASASILLVLGAVYLFGRYLKTKEPDKRSNKIKSEIEKINEDLKEIKGALSKTNVAKIAKKDRYF